MVDGHVAFDRNKTPLKRRKALGWKGQGVEVGMVDGHGALEKEEHSDWAGHGV